MTLVKVGVSIGLCAQLVWAPWAWGQAKGSDKRADKAGADGVADVELKASAPKSRDKTAVDKSAADVELKATAPKPTSAPAPDVTPAPPVTATPAPAAASLVPAPPMTALDRLRQGDTSGKFKEVDLDRAQLKIENATPLGLNERPVLKTSAAVRPATPRATQTPVFKAELNQRLREVELCRSDLLRSTVPRTDELKAGTIVLRWTVLPTGRTGNTAVLEQQTTSMDLMKCVRKRMDAWQFTPPASGSLDVEYTYTFGPLAPLPPGVASEAPTPAAPPAPPPTVSTDE